jgi:hypothetical protein
MKTKTAKTKKTAPVSRVTCDDLVEITGDALERASGGAGDDGSFQVATKTWRDSPPNSVG